MSVHLSHGNPTSTQPFVFSDDPKIDQDFTYGSHGSYRDPTTGAHLKTLVTLDDFWKNHYSRLGHYPYLEIEIHGEGSDAVASWSPNCEVIPDVSPPDVILQPNGDVTILDDMKTYHGHQRPPIRPIVIKIVNKEQPPSTNKPPETSKKPPETSKKPPEKSTNNPPDEASKKTDQPIDHSKTISSLKTAHNAIAGVIAVLGLAVIGTGAIGAHLIRRQDIRLRGIEQMLEAIVNMARAEGQAPIPLEPIQVAPMPDRRDPMPPDPGPPQADRLHHMMDRILEAGDAPQDMGPRPQLPVDPVAAHAPDDQPPMVDGVNNPLPALAAQQQGVILAPQVAHQQQPVQNGAIVPLAARRMRVIPIPPAFPLRQQPMQNRAIVPLAAHQLRINPVPAFPLRQQPIPNRAIVPLAAPQLRAIRQQPIPNRAIVPLAAPQLRAIRQQPMQNRAIVPLAAPQLRVIPIPPAALQPRLEPVGIRIERLDGEQAQYFLALNPITVRNALAAAGFRRGDPLNPRGAFIQVGIGPQRYYSINPGVIQTADRLMRQLGQFNLTTDSSRPLIGYSSQRPLRFITIPPLARNPFRTGFEHIPLPLLDTSEKVSDDEEKKK